MKRLLTLAFALVLVPACSSDEPGPNAAASKLRTETGFCSEWARVACNANVIEACESTLDDCKERQRTFCEDLVPSGYTAANASDCIVAVKTAYSDATLTAEEAGIVLKLAADCSQLIVGGREEGETCTDSFQCDTVHGYECLIKPGESTGSCEEPVVASGGERCEGPEVVCEDGNYCDVVSGRCFVIAPEDACTNDAMCGAAARCIVSADATEGTCEQKGQPRDPCASDADCESDFCVNQTCRLDVDLSLDTPFCADL